MYITTPNLLTGLDATSQYFLPAVLPLDCSRRGTVGGLGRAGEGWGRVSVFTRDKLIPNHELVTQRQISKHPARATAREAQLSPDFCALTV